MPSLRVSWIGLENLLEAEKCSKPYFVSLKGVPKLGNWQWWCIKSKQVGAPLKVQKEQSV